MGSPPIRGSSVAEEDLDSLRILLSLPRLGELVARVAARLTDMRNIEPPDFDGEEMRELAIDAFRYCLHMNERQILVDSFMSDLDSLPMAEESRPAHRPEFGFFDPPV